MEHTPISPASLMEGLVCVSDSSAFTAITRKSSNEQVYAYLHELASLHDKHISPAGGRIIKYLGDGALCFFPKPVAEAGVFACLELQKEYGKYMQSQGHETRLSFSIHFGPVALGTLPPIPGIDLFGETVNLAFVLLAQAKRDSFVLSQQAFRVLSPAGRKRFRKQSPPYWYVAT